MINSLKQFHVATSVDLTSGEFIQRAPSIVPPLSTIHWVSVSHTGSPDPNPKSYLSVLPYLANALVAQLVDTTALCSVVAEMVCMAGLCSCVMSKR